MSFGDHIEELRVCLIRAILGVVVGVSITLLVANQIVQTIQGPLTTALKKYYLNKASEDLITGHHGHGPPEMLETIKQDEMVPEPMFVEPQSLLAALREAAPQLLDDYQYKPYRFHTQDLTVSGLPEFCDRLRREGLAEKPAPGKVLWQSMSPEQQDLIDRLSDEQDITLDDERALLKTLNELADNPAVHQSAEFERLRGSFRSPFQWYNPMTWWQPEDVVEKSFTETITALRRQRDAAESGGEPFSEDDSRRLNRLLMADAFPELLSRPKVHTLSVPLWKPTQIRVQTLNAHEAFMIWLKAAVIAGLILASPWVFWQVWIFVAAGLYPHEKRYVHIYLPFSLALFLSGVALAFFFVFQPVLDFLFSFNRAMNIDPDPRISEWLGFVLFLPLGFGVAFQLPLVMLFLNRIGIFSVGTYYDKWRIAILAIFVISMFLTPADPISMLLMAVPLTLLYFLGIALSMWMPKGKNPFADAYEP